MSAFEFVAELPIRYRDLDPWDHVNNAVYGSYLEEARIQYLDSVLDEPMEEREFVLAHLELDYRAPVTYDEGTIAVAVRASDLGESSLSFAYEVRTVAGVAATGETTQVYMGEEGSPTPLPAAWRETIGRFEPAMDGCDPTA